MKKYLVFLFIVTIAVLFMHFVPITSKTRYRSVDTDGSVTCEGYTAEVIKFHLILGQKSKYDTLNKKLLPGINEGCANKYPVNSKLYIL